MGGFRPLAGCGLFLGNSYAERVQRVSVPLRGVGCFVNVQQKRMEGLVSVPLRGVGCFGNLSGAGRRIQEFPSPCGVWVVSAE